MRRLVSIFSFFPPSPSSETRTWYLTIIVMLRLLFTFVVFKKKERAQASRIISFTQAADSERSAEERKLEQETRWWIYRILPDNFRSFFFLSFFFIRTFIWLIERLQVRASFIRSPFRGEFLLARTILHFTGPRRRVCAPRSPLSDLT